MKIFVRSLLCVSLSIPAFTSCYDDSALWDKVNDMEARLNELEVEMTSQVEAMQALLSNGATLTSCKKNSDGSYTVTLSNGTKFKVLPEGTDFSSLVSVMVVDGKKCWATYDPSGNAVALTDASGKAIPVSVEVSVKIKDGVYCLVINGKEYETGYDAEDVVQVFSSCTPLTDASGNVYAVKFTFGEGMETTVALDGYKGVIFKLSSINNTVISEYYVDYGQTQSFLMDMQGVVDYVMQVPDGWRVKEVVEELTGETYLKVTAPSAETVALGAAVAEGDLKVVSVVEGGKAAISKMYVSTDPFKKYDVSAMKAVIEPYTGIQKFAYGMMYADDFKKDQLIEKVTELLSVSADLPAGYYISEKGIDLTLAEIFDGELSEEQAYVFWAIPALYREEAEGVEAGFYVEEAMLRTLVLAPVSADIEVSDVTLLDAKLKVKVGGTLSMYAGLVEKTDNVLEEIAYQINNGIAEPLETLNYEGPASMFPSGELQTYLNPETSYVAWVVPVDKDKTSYSASDVVYKEFTTNSIVSGGELELSVSDLEVTASSVSSELSCEGAAMIYYAFMNDSDGTRYSGTSDETKMSKILAADSFVSVRGNSTTAFLKGVKPESTKWIFAVAIGHDGKYGKVVCKSATTDKVSFNTLVLSVESLGIGSDEAKFQVRVSGGTATDFIYWCGYARDDFWVNDEYCGDSRTSAQVYLAANPDAEPVQKVMKTNGPIAEDGTITIKELSMSTDHVFIVLAKDESGKYSKAAYKKFTTLAADLGDLVQEGTDKWNEAKNQITLKWIEESFHTPENSNMSASYAFDYSGPKELTAFVICASDTYFEGMNLHSVEEMIVHVEETASRKYDNGYVPYKDGEMMTEPDYYKDGELKKGQLMNVYDYYVHGLPSLGFVTYFASGDHDGNCIYWEDERCTYYERALERIAAHNTLAPYRDRAAMFGLSGDEAEAWAEALLEAYKPFYENAEPIMFVNDGASVRVTYPYASGLDDEGNVVDRVVVVLRDKQGNYYAPMTFEVPNYFK
ncbi:MAG: hypothetical protein II991_06940 [Bacteroidales bacterium]|nr:hypothetical protein [Bacteroidales bacterium]